MIVIIPAYQPDEKLTKLVERLQNETYYPIVVVDDGSAERCKPLFDQLAETVVVLRHEVNRGKGAALKTALGYIQEHYPPTEGVITVDADGQHLVEDIVRVSDTWRKHPNALVLGSRKFTGDVPWKSRTGNAITRFVFALSTGVKVFDTQTGLRAFSVRRIPMMLSMRGDRYEYEINVLLYATRSRIPIIEVEIDTVYIEDNASSHFKPLRDAWRIYKMILVFVLSSLAALGIDYALVLILSAALAGHKLSLLISVVVARVISSFCNYFINRRYVFLDHAPGSILRYYLLAGVLLAINYGVLALLTKPLGIPISLAKIAVEMILYPLSFYMQRKYVFVARNEERLS